MPGTIPFIPSQNNYRLATAIDGVHYLFDVHWNEVELAWYFDMYQEDETPMATGVKVVLGTNLGALHSNPFFQNYVLQAVNTSGSTADAGFDDLGVRVVVQFNHLVNDLGL